MVLVVKNPPASAADVRDVGLIPGSGKSPGVGNGILFSILLSPYYVWPYCIIDKY